MSYFVCNRRKKPIQVWNSLRVSKWGHHLKFWVNHPFKQTHVHWTQLHWTRIELNSFYFRTEELYDYEISLDFPAVRMMWHISSPVFSRLPWCWLSWSPPKSSHIPSLKEDFIIADVTWPAVRISSTIQVIKAEDSSLLPLRTKDHHGTEIRHSYQYTLVQLHNKLPAKKYSQRGICGRWAHYKHHVVSWHVFILTHCLLCTCI